MVMLSPFARIASARLSSSAVKIMLMLSRHNSAMSKTNPFPAHSCAPRPVRGHRADALGNHALAGRSAYGMSLVLRRDPCVAADPRPGQPQPCTAAHDGAMLRVATRRKRAV